MKCRSDGQPLKVYFADMMRMWHGLHSARGHLPIDRLQLANIGSTLGATFFPYTPACPRNHFP
jgi:hypothetical protein